jgi:hypothetical protein
MGRYVKSRSDKQLRSKDSANLIKNCEPEGTSTDGAPIVPCGLVAWSLFNDTYSFSVNKKAVQVNKKDIAWDSDRSSKFGSDVYPSNFQKGGLVGGGKLDEKLPVSSTARTTLHVPKNFFLDYYVCKCIYIFFPS